ncbi:CMP deaminase, partial [bacterium]|nr:CMP deaminase [bacterium]
MFTKLWDDRFLMLSDHVAQWSKDPRTKVGSCIVNDDKQVIGLGYNGFPRGVLDIESRYQDRKTKLLLVAHAERNALDNCFTNPRGCTLYVTLPPCNECAKSIIQRGIKRVVTVVNNDRPQDNADVTKLMFA